MARILLAMPEVDETRAGALGASQGGGLTLACSELTPTLNRIAPMHPFLCDYFRQRDSQHTYGDEIFTLLGYIDNQHMAHRIKAKRCGRQARWTTSVRPPASLLYIIKSQRPKTWSFIQTSVMSDALKGKTGRYSPCWVCNS